MILDYIDKLLDRVTMYRLMIYFLSLLVATAAGLSLSGHLGYNALGILFSAGYFSLICWVTNEVFARVFEVPSNPESSIITGLILSLIITPYKIPHDLIFLTAAAGLAIASKYILTWKGKHIFNPAAIAVSLTAIGAGQVASWWVGNKYMAPVIIIGGWLVIRKIEREAMVISFLATALATSSIISLLQHHSSGLAFKNSILSSSLLFLAFVMLTEPATSPTTKTKQAIYGALAGFLWPPQIHLLSAYSTPERALSVANIFSFIISPRAKLLPVLKRRVPASKSVVDFVFQTRQPLAYEPGQYMEWTLPHDKVDSRGRRRYFTLASSPTEPELRLGVKFFQNGSSFKHKLLEMDGSVPIAASQLGGSFTMPKDKSEKLVFIAGGVGVTPYRSMLKYLIDKNERRDIVLLYSENSRDELAYTDVLETAHHHLGTKVVYTLTAENSADWHGRTGLIDADMIKAEVPDWKQRTFYISGPQSMVRAIKRQLQELDLDPDQIKTDFFPGYA